MGQLRQLQRKGEILRLCRLYEVKAPATDGAFFAGLKAALEVMGICARYTASPFTAMPVEEMSVVETILAEYQRESIDPRKN